MRFAPVHLSEDRALGSKVSQTFLKHYALCPRSGFFYAQFKGEASTREMQRGKVVHLIHERAVKAMLAEGEATIPSELVKAIADEVLAEIHVPFEEHDLIREQAFRLGAELAVDPSNVVACESLFALDVGGYEVRCRIDYAELLENGATVYVADLKSSRAAVPYEAISRKLPDGRLAATNFQLILYVLALVYGVPVREDLGAGHGGRGEPGTAIVGARETARPQEVREPFPIASRAQRADLEFVYPAIEDREGKMLRRSVSLSRAEIEQYRVSLEGLLARVSESERTGDWPAVASDAACDICPARRLCPIPAELNDHRGRINTPEECADALEVHHRVAAEQRAIGSEIRNFVKSHGAVRWGGDQIAEIGFQQSDRIPDKEAMFEAVDRARLYGEPFERDRFVKTTDSFPLVKRALTPDELAALAVEEDGDGEVEPERARDERFGDVPF